MRSLGREHITTAGDTRVAVSSADLPDARAAILGGLAGACLAALVVLLVIDWLTGLHNPALTLGLTCAAILLSASAASRLVRGEARRALDDGTRTTRI
jgi:hypothetical protein